MGCPQAEQPKVGKEGIRPACLIGAVCSGDPSLPLLPAQEAPQPAAYPAVQHAERSDGGCA